MVAISDKTPFVRQCVNLWIAGCKQNEFTVSDIVQDLSKRYPALVVVDVLKAVSNELQRLQTKHKLASRKGVKGVDGCGMGRPPRVFWCKVKFKGDER